MIKEVMFLIVFGIILLIIFIFGYIVMVGVVGVGGLGNIVFIYGY